VTFSGDKLMGGPQAGVIAGRSALVDACAAHPLARALRPGALVLAALQETLLAYLRRDGQAIPFWRMAAAPLDDLRGRAEVIVRAVGGPPHPMVVECRSTAGGGAAAGMEIPSIGLALDGDRKAELRRCDPPVIARTHNGRTICDLRSVDPSQDASLADALARLAATTG
jgi:L-seryl-tRNA(Ser) seleniumtransferase